MCLSEGQTSKEEGSVLIAAVLFMIILTLIGTAAMNTSTTEQMIAANDKFHKIAFFNADSGIFTAPKLISRSIDVSDQVSAAGIEYLDSAGDSFAAPNDGPGNAGDGECFNEIMGYSANDDEVNDIRLNLAGYDVDVDIQKGAVTYVTGNGVEFGAGIEGPSVGSTAGIRITYSLVSEGEGPGSSRSILAADYRKVLGVPGGL